MTKWRQRVVLKPGETLRHLRSLTKGFMGETDVEDYEVLAADGTIVGSVTVEDHTAVRGFQRTISVTQRTVEGAVVVQDSWTD